MNMVTKVETENGEQQRRPVTEIVAGLSRRQKVWIAAILVALVAVVLLFDLRSAPVAAAPPPPTVTVATPLVRQIAEWDD